MTTMDGNNLLVMHTTPVANDDSPSRVTKTLKCLLVLLLLCGHYLIRDGASHLVVLESRSFYSNRYATALALIFGKGFTGLPLPDVPGNPGHGHAWGQGHADGTDSGRLRL